MSDRLAGEIGGGIGMVLVALITILIHPDLYPFYLAIGWWVMLFGVTFAGASAGIAIHQHMSGK